MVLAGFPKAPKGLLIAANVVSGVTACQLEQRSSCSLPDASLDPRQPRDSREQLESTIGYVPPYCRPSCFTWLR